MAEKKGNRSNRIPTKIVTIRTTPQVVADLEKLVDTGYFGKSAGQAAELVMKEGLRRLMKEEGLPRASSKQSAGSS